MGWQGDPRSASHPLRSGPALLNSLRSKFRASLGSYSHLCHVGTSVLVVSAGGSLETPWQSRGPGVGFCLGFVAPLSIEAGVGTALFLVPSGPWGPEALLLAAASQGSVFLGGGSFVWLLEVGDPVVRFQCRAARAWMLPCE